MVIATHLLLKTRHMYNRQDIVFGIITTVVLIYSGLKL